MASHRRFRILTPERGFSTDTFVLPPQQPRDIKVGCTAIIHERTGKLLTVYDTQLFPAEAAETLPVVDVLKKACLKYDRVHGVIEIRLSCPDRGGNLHGMMESKETPAAPALPTIAPLMDYRNHLVGQDRHERD
jgi:hypothetical protein